MVSRVEGGRESTPNIEKECVKFSCTPRTFKMQGDKKNAWCSSVIFNWPQVAKCDQFIYFYFNVRIIVV